MWIIWVLAIIVFLIMEHTLVFWLVFVPLGLLLLLSVAGFFKQGRSGLSDLFLTMVIVVVIIIALIAVCS
jgi:hypothetical protein